MTKMKVRTLWISDIHLGTRACRAEQLRRFLKSIEADTIYLVGDIIDGWSMRSSWYWPASHSEILRLILKKSRDCRVIYIPGNHDEAAREYCPQDFGGIQMETYAVHITADGRRLIVLHGDIFDRFVTNLKHVAILGGIVYDTIIAINNINHWASNKLGLPHWSLAGWVKNNAKIAAKAIGRFENAAASYAKLKGFDGIIMGHNHHANIRQFDNITYYNDGDWVDSCSALVEHFNGEMRIIYTDEVDDLMTIAPYEERL